MKKKPHKFGELSTEEMQEITDNAPYRMAFFFLFFYRTFRITAFLGTTTKDFKKKSNVECYF